MGVVRATADWWDGIELWLTQLPFPLQVLLAVLVLVPLCWSAAAVVDRVGDAVAALVARQAPDSD